MITQDKKDYIQKLFAEGKSKTEISKMVGVSAPTVRRVLEGIEKKNDMLGQTFGKLTVISIAPKDPTLSSRCLRYFCRCECGEELIVNSNSLKTGHTTSCGCSRKGKNVKDLTGKKFGLLTVLLQDGTDAEHRAIWLCKCSCGREVSVNSHLLLSGHTTSCGCKKESCGELKITSVLKEMGCDFQKQYKIPGCSNIRPLPFDFAIFENGKLVALIEYQGDIHYHSTGGWNTKERLLENQERDKIKASYCRSNNIPLLIIPYWDYDKIDKEYIKKGINSGL